MAETLEYIAKRLVKIIARRPQFDTRNSYSLPSDPDKRPLQARGAGRFAGPGLIISLHVDFETFP